MSITVHVTSVSLGYYRKKPADFTRARIRDISRVLEIEPPAELELITDKSELARIALSLHDKLPE